MARSDGRALSDHRAVEATLGFQRNAEGSVLYRVGRTVVLCTASIDASVPGWMLGKGRGWITAEYQMHPRSGPERREARDGRGKAPSGRTQEIQRLIGRALRAVVDLKALGERQILIDCDVLQADGGTRTASVTGAYVALAQCFKWATANGVIKTNPLNDTVAAVSCGIVNGAPALDLDYAEDSAAGTDANFVITGKGGLVEVQGTAEGAPFSDDQFLALLALARAGCTDLARRQREAV